MDVNVLLPYKSAHFLWLLQFSSDSNKWRDWKKHGPSRHFEKQHFLQACSSASFSLPRLFLPNLLLLQSCLSSAAGPFPETASLHLCSSHLSGDSITHCCHMREATLLPPSTLLCLQFQQFVLSEMIQVASCSNRLLLLSWLVEELNKH